LHQDCGDYGRCLLGWWSVVRQISIGVRKAMQWATCISQVPTSIYRAVKDEQVNIESKRRTMIVSEILENLGKIRLNP